MSDHIEAESVGDLHTETSPDDGFDFTNDAPTAQTEPSPPSTPKRSILRSLGHSPLRGGSPHISPVNLPIRSSEPPVMDTRLETVDEDSPLPSSRQASPQRRSPLRAGSLRSPTTASAIDDSPARESLASVVRDYPDPTDIYDSTNENENELIFDDGDNRLPTVMPSPQRPSVKDSPAMDGVAISSPELPPDEFEEMDEGGGPLAEHLFGTYVEPTHVDYAQNRSSTASVFYPAPIPMQLMLPPLLSARSKAKIEQRPGLRRPKSMIKLDIPAPPRWDASPLQDELHFTSMATIPGMSNQELGDMIDDAASDYAGSDRATIMSEDRDEFEDPLEAPFDGPVPGGTPRQKVKRRSLFGRTWEAFTGKDGRWDYKEAKEKGDGFDVEEQEMLQHSLARDNQVAFTRLDPELVLQHAQMFHAGGVHSSTVPVSGKPTSLIEEIEIRKAGKKVQQQLLLRQAAERERERAYEMQRKGHSHAADALDNTQPSLLHLQQLADDDYRQRVEWHQRAVDKAHGQDHGNETLAQRRARIKAAKHAAAPPVQETLGQRRARLRQQRLLASSRESASIVTAPSVRSLPENGSGEDIPRDDAPASAGPHTPLQPSAPLGESPEFDMVHAVATMQSPTSQMFASPAH